MVLRALILVGGYGTRLRPLTFTKPKPLTEFANKAIVLHQIEALVEVGVKIVILAVGHESHQLESELKKEAQRLNIEIYFSLEKVPLGTAGPIALASKYLDPNDSDPFFMLNADVIGKYNFKSQLEYHLKHGKEGTIYVTEVKDPSRYGVVVSNKETGEISAFVEKPKELKYGNHINAGMYLLNKSVIKRVPMKPTSIERDIFPAMAKDGMLYAKVLEGYWMDVGKPNDFINGQTLYLNAILKENDKRLAPIDNSTIIGAVIIHPSAAISKTASIGPNVVIGPNVYIGDHVRIKNSCIFSGTKIDNGSFIDGSIIGWNCIIGKWCRITDLSILGEDVSVKAELSLIGTTVCPHKGVKESELKKGTIIL